MSGPATGLRYMIYALHASRLLFLTIVQMGLMLMWWGTHSWLHETVPIVPCREWSNGWSQKSCSPHVAVGYHYSQKKVDHAAPQQTNVMFQTSLPPCYYNDLSGGKGHGQTDRQVECLEIQQV